MRSWKPKPGSGLWLGLMLLLLVIAGVVILGARLALPFLQQPPELWPVNMAIYQEFVAFVLLLLLLGFLFYRVAGALTLRYQMDRNGLYIVWIGNRAVIPLSQVESVDIGLAHATRPWPFINDIGYYSGRGRTAEGKLLHRFSTATLARSLVIQTASDAYAISPAAQESFVQELEQRRRIGAVKSLMPTVEPGRIIFYAFWSDRVVRWALVLTFGINLLLLGVLAFSYPQLAENIAMRFDAVGQVTELRPRHQVLFLPLAAFVLSLLNTGLGLSFYRRNRAGAQLLQVGSVLVQVLFGVALLAIIIG
jgi:hypothetical protein